MGTSSCTKSKSACAHSCDGRVSRQHNKPHARPSAWQWRSHVQASGSSDTDDFVLTPYIEQFLAGYDPSKNHVRPQWPQHSSSQSICPAQQEQSTVHLLRLSPSDPSIYTYAGHIGELEKAKRCLASDPASANSLVEAGGRSPTLSASQFLLRASPLPRGLRSAVARR